VTESDKGAFAALLTDALAYWRQDVSDFTLRVWWVGCSGYALEQVSKAISAHAADPQRGSFAPMLADVVRQLDGTHTDRSLMAWGMVLTACREIGAYRSVVFPDAAIHAAIHDVGGWPAVCRCDGAELPHMQRRFCESFRAYAARGVSAWLPVMLGVHEASNAISGRIVGQPVLIGDEQGCRRVMCGPNDALRLAAGAVRVSV